MDEIFKTLNPYFENNGQVVGHTSISCSEELNIESVIRGIELAVEKGKLGVIQIPKIYKRVGEY